MKHMITVLALALGLCLATGMASPASAQTICGRYCSDAQAHAVTRDLMEQCPAANALPQDLTRSMLEMKFFSDLTTRTFRDKQVWRQRIADQRDPSKTPQENSYGEAPHAICMYEALLRRLDSVPALPDSRGPRSCSSILGDFADAVNSVDSSGSADPEKYVYISRGFTRIADAVPACRSDARQSQLNRNQLATASSQCRDARGGNCDAGSMKNAANQQRLEAEIQRIIAANQAVASNAPPPAAPAGAAGAAPGAAPRPPAASGPSPSAMTCGQSSGGAAMTACTAALREGGLNATDQATIYNNRGVEEANNGQYDAALGDFDHALQIDPDQADAMRNRAALRARMASQDGEPDAAKASDTDDTSVQIQLKEARHWGNGCVTMTHEPSRWNPSRVNEVDNEIRTVLVLRNNCPEAQLVEAMIRTSFDLGPGSGWFSRPIWLGSQAPTPHWPLNKPNPPEVPRSAYIFDSHFGMMPGDSVTVEETALVAMGQKPKPYLIEYVIAACDRTVPVRNENDAQEMFRDHGLEYGSDNFFVKCLPIDTRMPPGPEVKFPLFPTPAQKKTLLSPAPKPAPAPRRKPVPKIVSP